MAVDEKYVEEVRDAPTLDDLFEEMGVEGDYESGNGINMPSGYNHMTLNEDMYDGDFFTGKPVLGDIVEREFDDNSELDKDGNPVKRINRSVDLVLIDDESEETLTIKLNLKEEGDVQHNIYPASKLYKLIIGIANIKGAGNLDQYNKLKVANIAKIRKMVEGINNMTVKVVEESFGNNFYNSFVVVKNAE